MVKDVKKMNSGVIVTIFVSLKLGSATIPTIAMTNPTKKIAKIGVSLSNIFRVIK